MDDGLKGLRTGIVIRFEIKRLQALAHSKGFGNFLLAWSLVAPAHRSTLLHNLAASFVISQCSERRTTEMIRVHPF